MVHKRSNLTASVGIHLLPSVLPHTCKKRMFIYLSSVSFTDPPPPHPTRPHPTPATDPEGTGEVRPPYTSCETSAQLLHLLKVSSPCKRECSQYPPGSVRTNETCIQSVACRGHHSLNTHCTFGIERYCDFPAHPTRFLLGSNKATFNRRAFINCKAWYVKCYIIINNKITTSTSWKQIQTL